MKKRNIIQATFIMSVLGILGCEDPVVIQVCTPGQVYCVDESKLATCSSAGQIEYTPCEEGSKCFKKDNSYGCYEQQCDPVTFQPKCSPDKSKIIYCIDYKEQHLTCSDNSQENFQCVNAGEGNNAHSSATCMAQGESMKVCEQGKSRCSPETGVRQICNNEEWSDIACPSHQQCKNGLCVDIPECTEGMRVCQTGDDGKLYHLVCRDEKWVRTECASEQTCTDKAGCVADNGLPEEGDPCTEGAETFCVGGYFYECVNNQYAVVVCNESNGKLCLERETGDICVTDLSAMTCTNNQGQSVPCCSTGGTILGQICENNQFSYWKCIEVDGTAYAQEYRASSYCRNNVTRAYCIEDISLVQLETCPMGCAESDSANAICHGSNVGDVCTTASYASRCLNTTTVRYCDETTATIIEQACAENEICRQTICTSDPIPSEGEACMAGSPGYCIDSDYLECVNGVYVRTNCSAAIGKACFTFTDGDKCLEDVSNMTCTSRETGESVPCCASDRDSIVDLSCASGKIDFWKCQMVNGKGYANHYKLDSFCHAENAMTSCNGTAAQTSECTTGCVQYDTGAICNGSSSTDTCDPATYKSTCVNAKTQTFCNAEGKIAEVSCGAGEMCLTNKCEASSLPEVGTACTPGSISYCLNNSTILECIDNTYQTTTCPAEAQLCKTLATGEAACVNDLSTMRCTDPATGTDVSCCQTIDSVLTSKTCKGDYLPVYQCVQIDGVFYGRYYLSSGACYSHNARYYCTNNTRNEETCSSYCSPDASGFLNAVCK